MLDGAKLRRVTPQSLSFGSFGKGMKPAYRVHLIVDRAFAGRLDIIPRPIWIADTPANRPAIEEAWNQKGTDTHLDGVTSYQPRSDDDISEEILDLLPTLEEHHGIFSHDPPMDALVEPAARGDGDRRGGVVEHRRA